MKNLCMIALAVTLMFCVNVWAETGVSEQEILLGQSCALSGPAEALATGMAAGLNAYFSKVNAAGGIMAARFV